MKLPFFLISKDNICSGRRPAIFLLYIEAPPEAPPMRRLRGGASEAEAEPEPEPMSRRRRRRRSQSPEAFPTSSFNGTHDKHNQEFDF